MPRNDHGIRKGSLSSLRTIKALNTRGLFARGDRVAKGAYLLKHLVQRAVDCKHMTDGTIASPQLDTQFAHTLVGLSEKRISVMASHPVNDQAPETFSSACEIQSHGLRRRSRRAQSPKLGLTRQELRFDVFHDCGHTLLDMFVEDFAEPFAKSGDTSIRSRD